MKKGILYKIRRKMQIIAYDITSPEFISSIYFKYILEYKLNLKNPQTFNEKIQWLKLYNWPNNKKAIDCSDKYKVREYIKSQGYSETLNKLYGVWNNADDIDFDKLPEKFVLKCTHGCGYNIVCDNKNDLNIKHTKQQLNKWLKEDFGKFNAEPHYSKIKPQIICEKYLSENLTDYKFFCFNSKVEFMYIATGFGKGINEKITFFDKNGNKPDYCRADYDEYKEAKIPKNFKAMITMSERLSKEFPFVRVDWYEVDGKVYFGEMTFTPCGGLMKISPQKYDLALGEKLKININKKIGIIGHFGGDKEFYDGQTIKTKEINTYLENKYQTTTIKFDTYKNAKRPFKLIKGVKNVVKNSDIIIILLSSRGYKIILPFLLLLNKSRKKKTIEFVIGGDRQKVLKKNKLLKVMAKKLDRIYVETEEMKKEYEALGFKNTEVVNNFKNLTISKEKKYEKKKELHLCTFSRVCKEKGIEDAIKVVNECNQLLQKDEAITLDIYGQIDDSYEEEFEKIQKKFGKFIQYKGIVQYDSTVEVLKKYDLLLFLTYWKGEGFPGTLIDAFFSGMPTLATDWNFNFKILKDNYTGLKVQPHNTDKAIEKLLYIYNNQEQLFNMHKNCLNEAKKYTPDKIMDKVNKYIKSIEDNSNE